MDKAIRLLEDKKMVHSYISKFVEPSANIVDESKIQINRQENYVVGTYRNVIDYPYVENVNFVAVVSNGRVLIDYRKSSIVTDDNQKPIIHNKESHVGGFELNNNLVEMNKIVTNKTYTYANSKSEEKVVKQRFKYFRGETGLLENPYGFDEISLIVNRRK